MAKKRIIVPILALILVLIMSVGLFVACDPDEPQPAEYTVTFSQGDGTTPSVTVTEGTALTAEQIPNYVAAPGASVDFDGWFVGETEIKAGFKPTANVTAAAHLTNLYTVTFKNGDDTVKEFTVRAGTALTEDQIPEFTPEANFAFEGWFVGQNKVEAGFVVNANATATPVTTELFTVTFKNGDEVVKTVTVKSGSSVKAEDMPDDLQPALGFAFDGWFVEETKVEAGYAVSANVEAQPKFSDAMAGTYTDGAGMDYILDGAGVITLSIVDDYGPYTVPGTYTIADGVITAEFPDLEYTEVFTIIEDGKVIVDSGSYEYVKVGATFDENHVEDFVGLWTYDYENGWYGVLTAYVDISLDNGKVIALKDGAPYVNVVSNYNGTKLTAYLDDRHAEIFTIENGNLIITDYNYDTFTATKVDPATITLTVRFLLEDGTVVASQNVAYGQALDTDLLPSDTDIEVPFGFVFDGWFAPYEYEPMDESAKYYSNVDYTAQFTQDKLVVLFMNGETEVGKVAVGFGAELQASDIPAAVSGEGVFIGYYDSKNVKAEASVVPKVTYVDGVRTAIYNAMFVNEADYTGSWVNTTDGQYVIFGADKAVSTMGVSGTWQFDTTTGEAIYSGKDYYDRADIVRMLLVGEKLFVTHCYFDTNVEYTEDAFVLTKSISDISGTFYKNKNTTLELQNGVGTRCGGGVYFVCVDGEYIYYKASVNKDIQKIAIDEIDENGNIIISSSDNATVSGIWVKGDQGSSDYYNADKGYIYVFTVNNAPFVVYKDKSDHYYKATTDVAIAEGALVNLTYNETETLIVKISGTSFELPGAERNTYTGADGNLVLDGFGAGTLGETAIEYSMNAKGYVLIGEKAYVLVEGTYTVLSERDGYQGVFVQSDNDKYTYTFDGFGGVLVTYKSSYSQSEYLGEYSFNEGKTQLTIANAGFGYDGVYAIYEEGNVLDKSSSPAKVMLKQGYTPVDYLEGMLGYFESADKANSVEIVNVGKNIYVKVDNKDVYKAKSNYNHSVLTITVGSDEYTLQKEGEALVYSGMVWDGVSFDEDGTPVKTLVEISMAKATKEASFDTTSILGKWELYTESYYYTFEFREDKKVVVTRLGAAAKTVAYTLNNNVADFTYDYYNKFTCTLDGGVLSVVNSGYLKEGDAQKIADPQVQGGGEDQQLDAFAGTWTFAIEGRSFTFDGKGNVTDANGSVYQYTVGSNGKAEFNNGVHTVTCTIKDATTMDVHFDDGGDDIYDRAFTKQA